MPKLTELRKKRGDFSAEITRLTQEVFKVNDEIYEEEQHVFKETGFLPSLPETSDAWELYDKEGSEEAAKRLTDKLKQVLLTFDSLVKKHGLSEATLRCSQSMDGVMSQEAAFGATDTEPRYHMQQSILDHGRALGYEMLGEWL